MKNIKVPNLSEKLTKEEQATFNELLLKISSDMTPNTTMAIGVEISDDGEEEPKKAKSIVDVLKAQDKETEEIEDIKTVEAILHDNYPKGFFCMGITNVGALRTACKIDGVVLAKALHQVMENDDKIENFMVAGFGAHITSSPEKTKAFIATLKEVINDKIEREE